MSLWNKLFGSANDREIARLQKLVDRINALEAQMHAMTDPELRAQTDRLRARHLAGESLDDLLCEAFAVVREAGVRTLGQRAYDVQLLGGIVLHQGRIAEMRTGEGKTLTATLPSYLNALAGKGVHVVTVNDYLARYQSEQMGKVYNFLGLSVGLIVNGLTAAQRRAAYAADITYGTNNEFGFDYLRDNMVVHREDMVQRPLAFAIVDEVDSILIDEARTPLIISGAAEEAGHHYERADAFARSLYVDDWTIDEKDRTVVLSESGIARAERFYSLDNLADPENNEINHYINNALKARYIMRRDTDYVVQDGQVFIVDEFTGRLMVGRRYSNGLHQAIEAKENVTVQRESRTLATITFQNYFRMYGKLSGMTGTAKTEEEEFRGIYALDVVTIPTNMPMIRVDDNDVIFTSVRGKYAAVVEDIATAHAQGRPVLVGTVSVEKSELLSAMLRRRGVPHQVLNAKYHDREAQIVAQAGKVGAVTIATNMAGRGTDIMLGGNADYLAAEELQRRGFEPARIAQAQSHADTRDPQVLEDRALYRELYQKFKVRTDAEHDEVVRRGGLYILGTERHESRRIDNQLRGRAGRQGDPGESRFYIALEDDLLRRFGSERILDMVSSMNTNNPELENTPLEMGFLTKQIEAAQKRVESRNYQTRLHVLEYDNVMNEQREIIYKQRREVLENEDVHPMVCDMLRSYVQRMVQTYTGSDDDVSLWDLDGLFAHLQRVMNVTLEKPQEEKALYQMGRDGMTQRLCDALVALHEHRMAQFEQNGGNSREAERALVLLAVDRRWMDHIDAMDELRHGIGLRAYGQKNPVQEYQFEGFEMFEEMVEGIKEDMLTRLFALPVQRPVGENAAPRRTQVATPTRAALAGDRSQSTPKAPARAQKKVGRNDPCPCGSGKKYKNCCGAKLGAEE